MSEALDLRLTSVQPTPRQLAIQRMEFYGFVHFTVNTFTGNEWGDGTEPEAIFNPARFDACQWAEAACAAGMRGLILTCKHHDGFCLWPSKYTAHSVKNSPFKDGTGDIVREVADACRAHGLKFGVYLSPWDRNNPSYGQGKPYNDYFINQLTELLTEYGDIFCVWFDGACGEGKNGKRQQYDWARYYDTIRRLQPEACISVCGPDVRWCGNEAGYTRPSEWSIVAKRMSIAETVEGKSQNSPDSEFALRKIHSDDMDLGSRELLANEAELIWYPAEVNTSIRPGWFYHAEQDGSVKSLATLKELYLRSVGGNAMLLLNLPPNKDGLIHANDVAVMRQLGEYLRTAFANNIAMSAAITADSADAAHPASFALVDDDSYFATAPGITSVSATLAWPEAQRINYLVLQEQIQLSQRVERFCVYADGKLAYSGTTIGYKRIIEFPVALEARELRIVIEDSRVNINLRFIGAY